MAIDSRYTVNIQGRLFLKYGGVLAEALDRGLQSLDVELLQIPAEENGNVAICKATAVFERDGKLLHFSEIGDAAANNTAPMVRNAIIRMAATRAKGRALRDAIGHGDALAEEIGDGADVAPAAPPTRHPAPADEPSAALRDNFCIECGVELTAGQVKLSQAKYHRSLCPDHQRAATVDKAA